MSTFQDKWTFGVETEHFIQRGETPASGEDLADFFHALPQDKFDVAKAGGDTSPLFAAARSALGPCEIKPDYCSHILELAFPPLSSLCLFRELWEEYWGIVISTLARVGLHVRQGSVLPEVSNDIDFCHPRHAPERLEQFNQRTFVSRGPLSSRYCFAVMASTQVHLNLLDETFYSTLPFYYSMEYLYPLLFSNGREFQGQNAYCVRPLVLRDSLPHEYQAVNVPPVIPRSIQEYGAMLQTGKGLYRDYSSVTPSRYGTVEFRSACSWDQVDRIMEIIALRIAVAAAASQQNAILPRDARQNFYNVCEIGQCDSEILCSDIRLLEEACNDMPSEVSEQLHRIFSQALPSC
jgi:hypothetical protein